LHVVHVRTVNLGKWILRNLFQGFIREQELAHARRLRAAALPSSRTSGDIPATSSPPRPHSPPQLHTNSTGGTPSATPDTTGASSVVIVAHNILPALAPIRPIGLGIPHVPLPHTQLSPTLTAATATPRVSSESATQAQAQAQPPQQPGQGNSGATHQRSQTEASVTATPMTAQTGQDHFTVPTRRPSVSKSGAGATPVPAPVPTTQDESAPATGAAGAGVNVGAESNDVGGGNGGGATPGTPGGGFMGKLRGLGRTTKRVQNESTPGIPVLAPASAPRTSGPHATGAAAATGPVSSTGISVIPIATAVTSTTMTTATAAMATMTASSGTSVCPHFLDTACSL
jgi:WD repeat-containing protein 48